MQTYRPVRQAIHSPVGILPLQIISLQVCRPKPPVLKLHRPDTSISKNNFVYSVKSPGAMHVGHIDELKLQIAKKSGSGGFTGPCLHGQATGPCQRLHGTGLAICCALKRKVACKVVLRQQRHKRLKHRKPVVCSRTGQGQA